MAALIQSSPLSLGKLLEITISTFSRLVHFNVGIIIDFQFLTAILSTMEQAPSGYLPTQNPANFSKRE